MGGDGLRSHWPLLRLLVAVRGETALLRLLARLPRYVLLLLLLALPILRPADTPTGRKSVTRVDIAAAAAAAAAGRV